jgi:hypothetical protein
VDIVLVQMIVTAVLLVGFTVEVLLGKVYGSTVLTIEASSAS